MVSLRLCALLTAVAAVTTPPSHRETTALRGGFSAFHQKAGAVPFTVFGKESGARRLLERLRNGREPVPIAPSGDGDAVGARPALELEAELRDAAWRYGDNGRSVASVQNTYDAELEARAAPAALRSDDAAARAAREAAWVAATGTNLKRLENAKAYVPPPGGRVAYVPPLAGARDEFAADEPAIALDERSAPRDGGGLGLASLQRQRVAEEEAKGAAPQKTTEPGLASLQRQRVADEEAGGTARQKAAKLGLASLQRLRVAEEEANAALQRLRVAEEQANGTARPKAAEPGLASLQRQRVAEEEAKRAAAPQKTAEPGLASFQRQRIAEEEAKQAAQPRATEPGLASLQRQRVAEEEANGAARRKAAELGLASLQRQRVAEEEAKRVAEEGAGQLDEFVADEPAIIVEDAADEPAIVVEDPLDKRAAPLGDGGLGGILAQKAAELGLASLQRQRVAEEEAAKLKGLPRETRGPKAAIRPGSSSGPASLYDDPRTRRCGFEGVGGLQTILHVEANQSKLTKNSRLEHR